MTVRRGRAGLLLALALAAACSRKEPPAIAPSPAPAPRMEAPDHPPEPPAAAPHGGVLADALGAIETGRLDDAEEGLERMIAGEGGPGDREAAAYLLALVLARPDHPRRDVARARGLLEALIAAGPAASRETEARLVLSLLDLEADYQRLIADLRTRAASAGAEADDLRGVLSQREAELRRIKEILLGRAGGS